MLQKIMYMLVLGSTCFSLCAVDAPCYGTPVGQRIRHRVPLTPVRDAADSSAHAVGMVEFCDAIARFYNSGLNEEIHRNAALQLAEFLRDDSYKQLISLFNPGLPAHISDFTNNRC